MEGSAGALYALHLWPPQRGGGIFEVSQRWAYLHLGDLLQQPFAQSGRLRGQVQEAIVADVQIVLVRPRCAGSARSLSLRRALGDQPGKVAQTVSLGHLVVDVDPVPSRAGSPGRAVCSARCPGCG